MSSAHRSIRLYVGPTETQPTAPARDPQRGTQPTVTIELHEVLPLLLDAASKGRKWLGDFADDSITISSDLYEVLLAYQHHCKAA